MRVVAALGGNALLRRHQPADAEAQRHNVSVAVTSLVPIARQHDLVVTHGNGPQVGLLALQADAYHDVPRYPLDILGAESEGMIGYLLDQELASRLPDRPVATLLTQVVVDAADGAFRQPSKPIGALYDEVTARRLAAEHGWAIGQDGDGYRRLVPSPQPIRIVELTTIELLVRAGVLVVCAGGGGIPVTADASGYRGVEAVIDKDLTAALLAVELDADVLLLLTDVDAVYASWGTRAQRRIPAADPSTIRALDLPAGSMGPKAEAAARFAEATGRPALIGPLDGAEAMLAGDGRVGTRVCVEQRTLGRTGTGRRALTARPRAGAR
jgi:carbamate kinase